MSAAALLMSCKCASFITSPGPSTATMSTATMYAFMYHRTANFSGETVSIQAYRCVAASINNAHKQESTHTTNYSVQPANSNREQPRPLSQTPMVVTGI